MEDARVRLGLRRGLACPRDRFVELVELLAQLRERACEIRPVVADGRRAPLHLAGLEQRRKRLGDVVEDPLAALLLGLQRLPALSHAARRSRVRVAEDVRMPSDELRVNVTRDRLEVALAALLEEEREEVDLEEEVAELTVKPAASSASAASATS